MPPTVVEFWMVNKHFIALCNGRHREAGFEWLVIDFTNLEMWSCLVRLPKDKKLNNKINKISAILNQYDKKIDAHPETSNSLR